MDDFASRACMTEGLRPALSRRIANHWRAVDRRSRVLGVALLLSAVVACIKPAPAAPVNPFAGTWIGSVQDESSGTGTLRLSLRGNADGMSDIGSFSLVWASGSSYEGSALINSRLIPTSSIVLTCSASPGLISLVTTNLNATASGDSMTGSYGFGCGQFNKGTFSLTRQ